MTLKNEKKVSVFLSVIGSTAYGTLKNLLQPDLPKDKNYAELVTALKDHYMPKPLVISERFKFNKRNQSEIESINAYVVELKRLATHCEFGGFLKEAIRDRLVCGLRSEEIQKRLLSQADLDLDNAIRISCGMETAAKDTSHLWGQRCKLHGQGTGCNVQGKTARYETFAGEQEVKSTTGCLRCGSAHNSDTCKFKDATCYLC